jgi:transcription antitermination factor NusG
MYRPRTRSSKRGREVELPLFSGYVFCRYNAQIKQPILTTPGVIRILGRGGRAAPLEDSDMDAIRRLAAWGMDVRPEPYVAAGQTVLVESGPLTGLLGTVVRSKSRHRLLISVALLQRSVSVEIDDWSLLSPGHRSDPLAPPHSPQPIYQPGVR